MNFLQSFERWSRPTLWAVGLLLILLIGTLDYSTGSEISFSIFYLVPVSLAAWTLGRRGGVGIAILSTTAWLGAERALGTIYLAPAIPYWNAAVRLSFFLIVAFTLAALHDTRTRQEDLSHFVVHDLRSPVSNIQTAMTLMLDTCGDELPDEARDLVDISMASSARMLTLINSMLDLAKLESGKMTLNQEVVAIRQFVDPAVQQVLAMAQRGDVQVSVAIADEVLACADLDVTVRILVNLLNNAIKHSPSNSTVTVSADSAGSDRVAIRVSDQGSGVPAEWRDKVFDRFSQVEARQAGFAVGSGLGLTFCRLAVEAQGGRIWLEGEPDQGTTAVFTLPQSG
jgi:signal transduction histidine kinase